MQKIAETSPPPASAARAAAALLVMLVATTSLSQFFRASTNVIAPELIRDLALTPEMLGFANACFFFALLAIQVPVGILFDRLGARRTVGALSVLAVAGAVLHAAVASGPALSAARFLLGLGHGGSFMASIFLVSRWYPRQRWTTVLSWVWAGSMLGIAAAGTPLALAASLLGWRQAFLGLAAVSAGVGLLFVVLVRDMPPGRPAPPVSREGLIDGLRGFFTILRLPGLLRVLALQAVAYAVLTTIMGLWAGPYLHDVHGLSGLARGNVLVAMAAGQVVGLLLIGPLDRLLDTRKWVAVGGASLSLLTLVALSLRPSLPTPAAIALLVLLTTVSAYGPVVVSHARTFYPEALAGRGVTTANMAQLLGCAIMPLVTGLIPGLFPVSAAGYAAEAYRWIFATIAAALVAGLAVYLTSEDVPPSRAAKVSNEPVGKGTPAAATTG
ncbi:MAG: MFS transporter [Proteobacteria bacterium]|nr:MFS transporter [Pseudomonadota bacterium]